MKNLYLIIFFFLSIAVSKGQTQSNDEAEAKAMLKTFYTKYMSVPGSGKSYAEMLIRLRKEYCTANCEKDFARLGDATDADPLINAQDDDPQWVKKLSIKADSKKPDVYIVSYTAPGYKNGKPIQETMSVKLQLIKQNGKFKIDHIL